MDTDRSTTMARLGVLTADQRGRYAASIALAVVGVAAGMVPYLVVAALVVALLSGEQSLAYYLGGCAIAVAGYVIKVAFATWSTSLSHTATYQVLRSVRQRLMSKLSRLSLGDVQSMPSGKLKDLIVDRVEGLETTLAHMVPEITANAVAPVALLIYVAVLDWRMALISLITLPIGMCFVMIMFRTYPAKYEGSVEASQRMASAVVEYVGGIEVIKAFGQGARSYQRYTDAVVHDASYFYEWMKSCQWPMSAYTAICPATLATVLPIGCLFCASGSLAPADFVTIVIVSLGIIGPLLAVSNYLDSLASLGTVVDELYAVLDRAELSRPEHPASLSDETIRLDEVRFSYEGEGPEALRGVDLTVPAGSVTALVGPSGSGKSTIAKLIAGFWDPDEGVVSLGGVDLRDLPLRQLADHIAYVAQDNYLFDDTVRENIRVGRPTATDDEVVAIARAAGCHDFIEGLDDGYDTVVGGAGGHLSGGERQRIAIARAMLKDAPIVVLDEATAYLDPENEAVMQRAISALVASKTLIVVAHRLSTIIDSDQIVVVSEGRIEAQGSHDDLLASSELYRSLWQAHLGTKDGEQPC